MAGKIAHGKLVVLELSHARNGMAAQFLRGVNDRHKKLGELYDKENKCMPKDIMKQLKTFAISSPVLKPLMKNAMQVGA